MGSLPWSTVQSKPALATDYIYQHEKFHRNSSAWLWSY